MEYNIKLSKGKININGKEYDIPDEVAKFIIYETSTRDDIIQTRDVYKRTIDKAIDFIVKETKSMPTNGCKIRLIELLDILKVVR
ncbi:MAG: hypothetical protein MSA56_16200 [Clostridium sp.]|nr:hypothetical protein [Clostridium sp.]